MNSEAPQEIADTEINKQEVTPDQQQKLFHQQEEPKEVPPERESNNESYLTENKSQNMSILSRSKMSDTGIYYRNKCVQLESKEKKQNVLIVNFFVSLPAILNDIYRQNWLSKETRCLKN